MKKLLSIAIALALMSIPLMASANHPHGPGEYGYSPTPQSERLLKYWADNDTAAGQPTTHQEKLKEIIDAHLMGYQQLLRNIEKADACAAPNVPAVARQALNCDE